jgi:aryl carrier-like protein
VSAKDIARNKENRGFLHDIASPMTILGLVLKKLAAPLAAEAKPEDLEHQEQLRARALASVKKMEELHANFKQVLAAREHEDAAEDKKNQVP